MVLALLPAWAAKPMTASGAATVAARAIRRVENMLVS
jgi:hypothetical protein